jgi:hypothetical protein
MVVVDSTNRIAETNESDNTTTYGQMLTVRSTTQKIAALSSSSFIAASTFSTVSVTSPVPVTRSAAPAPAKAGVSTDSVVSSIPAEAAPMRASFAGVATRRLQLGSEEPAMAASSYSAPTPARRGVSALHRHTDHRATDADSAWDLLWTEISA